jgi:hypothetical protein
MRGLAVALLLALAAGSVRAEVDSNAYQALSDTLQPFLNLFVSRPSAPERAMRCKIRLLSMTDLPEEYKGARIEAAVQYPDKWILRGDLFGEPVAFCRSGQKVWVSPGKKIEFMISQIADLPAPDPTFRMTPFESPIPEKQLVWFPVLFGVTGDEMGKLGETPCRAIEVGLAPELAKSLKVEGWRAKLWIDAESRPAQLALVREGWQMVIRFDSVEFGSKFPESLWQPPAELEKDVLWLEAPRVKQLLDAADREIKKGRARAVKAPPNPDDLP